MSDSSLRAIRVKYAETLFFCFYGAKSSHKDIRRNTQKRFFVVFMLPIYHLEQFVEICRSAFVLFLWREKMYISGEYPDSRNIIYQLFERFTSLGIVGAQWRAFLKPLDTIVLGCLNGFKGAINLTP